MQREDRCYCQTRSGTVSAEYIHALEVHLVEALVLLEHNHEHRGICPDDDHAYMERVRALLATANPDCGPKP